MNSKYKNFYKKRNRGDVMMLTTIFFLVVCFIILSGLSFTTLRDIRNMRSLVSGRVSYYVSEAGMEDAYYRLKNEILFASNNVPIDGNYAGVTFTNNSDGSISLTSLASTSGYYKRITSNITAATAISFPFGLQSGTGGFSMVQSASIIGDVFSNGIISGAGNYIYGNVTISGTSTYLYGIHATGTVYSHTIGSSTAAATTIDKDAYYQSIANTTVSGISHAGSADPVSAILPISDTQVQKWENDAVNGGIMLSSECDSYDSSSNTCTITSNKTMGPKKIPFNWRVVDCWKFGYANKTDNKNGQLARLIKRSYYCR